MPFASSPTKPTMLFDYCLAGIVSRILIRIYLLHFPRLIFLIEIKRHEFHKICVDPWLLEHRTCPMCKMDILKHYGYVVISITIVISFALRRMYRATLINVCFIISVYRKSRKRRQYGFRRANYLRITSWST